MANKKSMFAYNPRVDYNALQSTRKIAAENLRAWNAPYTTGTLRNINLDDREHTEENIDYGLVERNNLDYDDNGRLLNKKDAEKKHDSYEPDDNSSSDSGHWYDGITSTLFGKSKLSDAIYAGLHAVPIIGNPIDVWREFQKIYNQTELGAAEAKLENISLEKQDIDYLENVYKPLLYQYMDQRAKVNDMRSRGMSDQAMAYDISKLDQLGKQLNEQNEYIKTEGKQHPILRNMFFDASARDKMNLKDLLQSEIDQIWQSEKMSPYYGGNRKVNSVGDFLEAYVAGPIADAVFKPFEAAGNILDFVLHSPDNRYSLNNALQNVDVNDRRFDNLFIDWTKYKSGDKDSKNSFDFYLNLNKNDVLDRYVDTKRDALKRIDNLAHGNFWFDPSKIDKRYDDIVNKDDFGLVGDLTYGLAANIPQLGSSFSDLKDFALSIGTDAAVSKVVAPILIGIASGGAGFTKSIGKGLVKQLEKSGTMAIARNAIRSGEAVEAAASAESAANTAREASVISRLWNGYKTSKSVVSAVNNGVDIENAIKAAQMSNPIAAANTLRGVRAAEGATQIYLTNQMRQNESNAEVMDAYSSRIMQQMMDGSVNVKKVFDSADDFLRESGINPDSLDDQQKLQAILGFNIQTGDPEFEAMKKDARRGLNKVYNDNMTLAVMDYWEKLPYLPFANSAIRDWGRNLSNKLGRSVGMYGRDLTSDMPFRMFNKNIDLGSKTARNMAFDYQQQLIDRTAGRLVSDKLTKATQWMLNRFKKKDGTPNLGRIAAFDNAIRYAGRKIKQMAFLGGKEALEEGQQQIIQSDYQSGRYDNYNENKSNFDPGSFIADLDLGANAALSYLGLNFGNPYNGDEDLRHAMNVGFAVSQMFRAPAALSNLHKSSDDNLRNAIAQLRTDRTLAKMVAENYGRIQDQDHAGIFFDAMQKHGVTSERLLGSLAAMKLANQNVENSGVKDEYIDNDMQILADTDDMLHSDYIQSRLKANNIKKGSSQHRIIIQNGVRTIRDFKDQFLKSIQQGKDADAVVEDIIKKAQDGTLDDSNKVLNEIVDAIHAKFKQEISNNKAAQEKAKKDFKKSFRKKEGDRLRQEFADSDEEVPMPEEGMTLQEAQDQYIDEAAERAWEPFRIDFYKQNQEKSRKLREGGKKQEADELDKMNRWYEDLSENAVNEKERSFVRNVLRDVFAIHRLNVKRQTLQALKDRSQFNNLIKKVTGTDINTSRLDSAIKYIEQSIANTEKIITPELESKFEDEFGKLDSMDSYDNDIKSYTINAAIAKVMQPFAQAYSPGIMGTQMFVHNKRITTKSGDTILPSNLSLSTEFIQWNELSKEDQDKYRAKVKQEAADNNKPEPTEKQIRQKYYHDHIDRIKEVKGAIHEYTKELHKLQEIPEQERTTDQIDKIDDLFQKISDAVIMSDLNNGEIRQYIVNKIKEDERPISGQDIDDAQDGDKKAQDKVSNAVKQEEKEGQAEDKDQLNDDAASDQESPEGKARDVENPEDDKAQDILDQNNYVDEVEGPEGEKPTSKEIQDAIKANQELVGDDKPESKNIRDLGEQLEGGTPGGRKRQDSLSNKADNAQIVSQVLDDDDKATSDEVDSEDLKDDIKHQIDNDQKQGQQIAGPTATPVIDPVTGATISNPSVGDNTDNTDKPATPPAPSAPINGNSQSQHHQQNNGDSNGDKGNRSDSESSGAEDIVFDFLDEKKYPDGCTIWSYKGDDEKGTRTIEVFVRRDDANTRGITDERGRVIFNPIAGSDVDVEFHEKQSKVPAKYNPGPLNHLEGLYQTSKHFPKVINIDYFGKMRLPRFRFRWNGHIFFLEYDVDYGAWQVSKPTGKYNDAGQEIQNILSIDEIPSGMTWPQLGAKIASNILPQDYIDFVEQGHAEALNAQALEIENVTDETNPLTKALRDIFGIKYHNYTAQELDSLRANKLITNHSARIYIPNHHDIGYFEIVKDAENDYYSVHFKPVDDNNPHAFTDDQKEALFSAMYVIIPKGGLVSTWGSITKGGLNALTNRFGDDNGFTQVGEREVKLKDDGSTVKIPIWRQEMDDLQSVKLQISDHTMQTHIIEEDILSQERDHDAFTMSLDNFVDYNLPDQIDKNIDRVDDVIFRHGNKLGAILIHIPEKGWFVIDRKQQQDNSQDILNPDGSAQDILNTEQNPADDPQPTDDADDVEKPSSPEDNENQNSGSSDDQNPTIPGDNELPEEQSSPNGKGKDGKKRHSINPDELGQLDYDNSEDVFYLGDDQLADDVATNLMNEEDLLMTDENGGFNAMSGNTEAQNTDQTNTEDKDRVFRSYIGTNFRYDPTDPTPFFPRTVGGSKKKGGTELKYKYKLGNGKELSQKLLIKDWINSCDVYYVVSGDLSIKGSPYDNLGIDLVIDDPNSKTTYLLSMNRIGKYTYQDNYGHERTFDGYQALHMQLAFSGICDIAVDKTSGNARIKDSKIAADYNKYLKEQKENFYIQAHSTDPARLQRGDEGFDEAVEKWYNDIRYGFGTNDEQKIAQGHRIANNIEYNARVNLAQSLGKQRDDVQTESQINKAIQNLSENRKAIIDAYCDKSADGKLILTPEIKTHIRPKSITTSNGKINLRRDSQSGLPIFRKLDGEQNKFGLSDDIEELTRQIDNGDEVAEFGIGSGAFGNQPFAIMPADDNGGKDVYYGHGLAGKIYYIISEALMPGSNIRKHRLPLQLRESGFKTQVEINGTVHRITNKSQLHLVLDPKTGLPTGENAKKYHVSAAEAIFYLMVGKTDYLGLNLTSDQLTAFRDFIVNNGEQTFLYTHGRHRTKEQIISAKLPYYCLKQFGWMIRDGQPDKFVCGTTRIEERTYIEDGKQKTKKVKIYERHEATMRDLFPDDSASPMEKANAAALREDIIFNISQNLHWNTERSVLNDRSTANQTFGTVMDALRQYFNTHDAKEIKLFGCDALTFKRDDLFVKNENTGRYDAKAVNGLAWLIHTGRLMTDSDTQLFTAPFVYAQGVDVDQAAQEEQHIINNNNPTQPKEAENNGKKDSKNKEKKGKKTPKGNTEPKTPQQPASILTSMAKDAIVNQQASEGVKNKQKPRLKNAIAAQVDKLVKEGKEKILEALRPVYKGTGASHKDETVSDMLLMDIPDRKNLKTKEDVEGAIRKKIDEYNEYAKAHNMQVVDPKKVTITQNFGGQLAMNAFKAVRNPWIMKMIVFTDGSATVSGRPAQDLESEISNVTGVFSTQKQHGKFNEAETRQWIAKILGIPEENSIVVSAMRRACDGSEAFGLTQVCVNSLTNDVIPIFMFSKRAGKGIGYHEAWHYVNLLLNNPATRQKIYKDYVEHHKKYKGAKYKDIEEAMAEDFRRYVQMMDGTGLSSRIKRFFNNILDFLFAARKTTETRMIFEAIRSGKAKGMRIDPESLKEFQRMYPEGVYNAFKIPGRPIAESEKLNGINSYKDFNDIATAIGFDIISEYDITTIGKLRMASDDSTDIFREHLMTKMANATDPDAKVVYQTILDNPAAFARVIHDLYQQLGIDATLQKEKAHEQTEKRDDGDPDTPVDGHLENQFEVSKKANVAFRAKLFLMQNKKGHFVLDPVTGKRAIDKTTGRPLIENDMGVLSTKKYVPFNEAWNKILNDLWMSDSYNAKDQNGNYTPTSILGNVERLAKTDPFYESLFTRLEDIDGDIELQNQIFTTVCSQKPQIAFYRLQDPKKPWINPMEAAQLSSAAEDVGGEIGGTNSTIGSKQVYDRDREWVAYNDNTLKAIKQLPRTWSGIVPSSEIINNGVVDKRAVANLRNFYNQTRDILFGDEDVEDKVYEGKQALEQMLLGLHIPVDEQVVDRFISLLNGNNNETPDVNTQLNILKRIFDSKIGGGKPGSISYFVKCLEMSVGHDYFSLKKKGNGSKQVALDQLFNGFAADTHISLLAEAYNDIHPGSAEFSISAPGHKTIYPINQNNEMSDKINRMNIVGDESIQNMQRDPYCQNSILMQVVNDQKSQYEKGQRVPTKESFKLCTFVGIDDTRNPQGEDYFGISSMEDYIAKLMMTTGTVRTSDGKCSITDDMLILPTMSDKKTWYAIKSPNLHLVHDTMTWFADNANGKVRHLRFSDRTLNIFYNYFMDELNALIQYYSRGNVQYLVNHPQQIKINYHGKVENGRLQFGGNGGLFRYGYGAISPKRAWGPESYNTKPINLNQYLEFLYKAQKEIEDHPEQRGGIGQLIDDPNIDLDGFELIRKFLSDLKKQIAPNGSRYDELLDGINDNLIEGTKLEMKRLSQEAGMYSPMRMFQYRKADEYTVYDKKTYKAVGKKPCEEYYQAFGLPKQILEVYRTLMKNAGYVSVVDGAEEGDKAIKCYDYQQGHATADYALSAIASHVANTAISIIECEKVFMGDPAFYKWKYIDSKSPNASVKLTTSINVGGRPQLFSIDVQNLREKGSDKTKRRGSVLSPGENIRDLYGEDILTEYPELNKQEYTFASINDFKYKSLYLDEVQNQFERQEFVNWILKNPDKYFGDEWKKMSENKKHVELNKLLNKWYSDTSGQNFKSDYDLFDDKNIIVDGVRIKQLCHDRAVQSTDPYRDVNVADAEVVIRPEMYRYLRIAVGEWTFEPDETGYSDEEAYKIIEGIGEYADRKGEWMTNQELARKVLNFQLKPLKMTYFSNESTPISQNQNGALNFTNVPIYNKMAIFPMFGFACMSETGKALYDRMNKKGQEIDMLGFESAVKVGDSQNKYTPFPKNGKEPQSHPDKLAKVGKSEFQDSNSDFVNKNGKVVPRGKRKPGIFNKVPEDALHIERQYIKNLRLQMNTDEHEHDSRAIGTQMFKLCFSNIEDEFTYGLNMNDWKGQPLKQYTGSQLKQEIMATINAMTAVGYDNIKKEFFDRDGNLVDSKVENYMLQIVKNNNMGANAEEMLANHDPASVFMSRLLFEQSVIKHINKEVVDKETQGGSAIQQSMFGFSGHRNVLDYNGKDAAYHQLNGGHAPKWIARNNSMEVFLSMNFFRSVLPDELFNNGTYQQQRQWLIEHDFIYGTKADGTKSHPNPFGIGYRIPTQGQSSIFAFTVADVLPKQSGDTIIVPPEFTAQTGSDFDVDKLYLATLACKDGKPIESEAMYVDYDEVWHNEKQKDGTLKRVYESKHVSKAIKNQKKYDDLKAREENGEITNLRLVDKNSKDFTGKQKMELLLNTDKKALANKLIQLYMRVLTDPRNFKQGRGSIDTITDIIKHRILPHLQAAQDRYLTPGNDLLPTEMSKTKLEFSTGKSGIGPYALAVTNSALTQWSHLTFDYEENYFGFGDLDETIARDGTFVSDWLSAMVNAHVDVAKDPYIFDLNLSQATYSMSEFLLRAGVGAGTFTFLANPVIKDLANKLNNTKSFYGQNLSKDTANPHASEQYIALNMLLGPKIKSGKNYVRSGGLLKQVKYAYEDLINDKEASKKLEKQWKKDVGDTISLSRIGVWIDIMSQEINMTESKNKNIYGDDMRAFGSLVFNLQAGFRAIDHPDDLFGQLFSCMCLYTWHVNKKYADELNNLVQVSRVDTKKFGNTVSLQTNYINKYNKFRYGSHKARWILSKRSNVDLKLTKEDGIAGRTMKSLDYYFEKTYLNDELVKATQLARDVLRHQLYTATPQFQDVLKNTLGEIYGKVLVKNSKGETLELYQPNVSQDNVTELSNALDNITRYQVLQLYGPKYESDINLARDPNDIKQMMHDFIFGNNEAKNNDPSHYSIFKQVQMLIDGTKREQTDPNKADISDLKYNELLAYITPIQPTKTSKYPFGRFLLRNSAVGTGIDQKDVLRQAWYDLLTYDRAQALDPKVADAANKWVQNVAKNLVLFSYFQTYDQNGANSFFELVPDEFRIQYDKALRRGLRHSYDTFKKIGNAENGKLYDILARNYWWNDNIIKEFSYLYRGNPKNVFDTTSGGSGGIYSMWYDKVNKKRVFGCLILNDDIDSLPHGKYFKIKLEDQIFLYRRVGVINVKFNVNNKPKTVSRSVYIPIPKGGMHVGRQHQYEFYVDENTPSIFQENQLPSTFKYSTIYENVIKPFVENKDNFFRPISKSEQAKPNQINHSIPRSADEVLDVQYVEELEQNDYSESDFYFDSQKTANEYKAPLKSDDGSIEFNGFKGDSLEGAEIYGGDVIDIDSDRSVQEICEEILKRGGTENESNPKQWVFNIKEEKHKFKPGEITEKITKILQQLENHEHYISTIYMPIGQFDNEGIIAVRSMLDTLRDGMLHVVYDTSKMTEDDALDNVVSSNPDAFYNDIQQSEEDVEEAEDMNDNEARTIGGLIKQIDEDAKQAANNLKAKAAKETEKTIEEEEKAQDKEQEESAYDSNQQQEEDKSDDDQARVASRSAQNAFFKKMGIKSHLIDDPSYAINSESSKPDELSDSNDKNTTSDKNQEC